MGLHRTDDPTAYLTACAEVIAADRVGDVLALWFARADRAAEAATA